MANPESQFIASVHRYLPSDLHKEKNHNMYRSGTADCWYSGILDDLWVEYKFEPRFPVQDRFVLPKLTDNQKTWCDRRYNEGRNVIVIVGYPRGGVIHCNPQEWSIKGLDLEELKERIKERKELANFIYNYTMGKFIDEL